MGEENKEQPKETKKKPNLVYAALLLNSSNQTVNENNVKKVMNAAGANVDDMQIKALVAALEDVNISEVIEKAAMPVAVAPAETKTEAVKEKKEEVSEAEKEKKAEEAAAGLGALFG